MADEKLTECQMGNCPSGDPHCEGCGDTETLFVIWWLTQADYVTLDALVALETVGNFTCDWPEWLWPEVESRRGRAGRGRLWNAFPSDWRVSISPWPETTVGKALEDAGGIVLPLEYLHHVIGLPGLVTNTNLDRLCVNGVDVDL